jgi:hypothetical protein
LDLTGQKQNRWNELSGDGFKNLLYVAFPRSLLPECHATAYFSGSMNNVSGAAAKKTN